MKTHAEAPPTPPLLFASRNKPPRDPMVPASRWRRLLARLVDDLVGLSVGAGTYAFVQGADSAEADTVAFDFLLDFSLGFLLVQVLQSYLITYSGQTIGKRLFRIRILDTYGDLPGFFYGFLVRELVATILSLVRVPIPLPIPTPIAVYAPIPIDVLPIFGSQRRCIHDRLAGTWVVEA